VIKNVENNVFKKIMLKSVWIENKIKIYYKFKITIIV